MKVISMLDESPGDPALVRPRWWSTRVERFACLKDVGWFKIHPTFRAASAAESSQLYEYRRKKLMARMAREVAEKERTRKIEELSAFRERLLQLTGIFASTEIEEPK